MMDKVQKPSNSERYRPSSEPFRIFRQMAVDIVWRIDKVRLFVWWRVTGFWCANMRWKVRLDSVILDGCWWTIIGKLLISIFLFNTGICPKEIVLKLTVPFHSIFNRCSSSGSLFRMSGLLDRLIVNEIQITNFIRITNIHTRVFVAVNTNKSDSYKQHLSYNIIEYFYVKILL
jgi:hypothetical protein